MPRYDGPNMKTDETVPHVHLEEQLRLIDESLPSDDDTGGWVYILHGAEDFGSEVNRRHGRAQHYLGSAVRVKERCMNHAKGIGRNDGRRFKGGRAAKIVKEMNRLGILYQPEGCYFTSAEEARLAEAYAKKVVKNTKRLCPCCNEKAHEVWNGVREALAAGWRPEDEE